MNKTYTPFTNKLIIIVITTLYIISILWIYNGVPAIKVYADHAFALLGMFYIGNLIPSFVDKIFPIDYKVLTDTLPISKDDTALEELVEKVVADYSIEGHFYIDVEKVVADYSIEGHFYIDEESKINFNQIIPVTYINCLDRDITIIQYFKEIIISKYLLKDDVEIYITNITIGDIKCFKELK